MTIKIRLVDGSNITTITRVPLNNIADALMIAEGFIQLEEVIVRASSVVSVVVIDL